MNLAGAGSILYLLGRTLLELLVLPVHVLLFLFRRARIRREIREIIENQR